MDLLQLKYFRAVATMESMTKAAEFFKIPQPAISQAISRLEKGLGNIKLFDRTPNRVTLNANGKRFLEYVDKAMNALEDGEKSLRQENHEMAGSIHLLVRESRRFIFYCVSEFSKMHPGINFSVMHNQNAAYDVSYDLCVQSVTSLGAMNAFAPLIKEEIVLNVNVKHPLAQHKNVSFEKLRGEKFITMSPGSVLHSITFEQCRLHGFEPNVPFICDDPYFVRKYVSSNMGIAFSPAVSWDGRFRENTVLIPLKPQLTTVSYIVWDDSRYMTPAVRAFRDFILSESEKLPGNMK